MILGAGWSGALGIRAFRATMTAPIIATTRSTEIS